MRDLVRARLVAVRGLRRARQQLLGFLRLGLDGSYAACVSVVCRQLFWGSDMLPEFGAIVIGSGLGGLTAGAGLRTSRTCGSWLSNATQNSVVPRPFIDTTAWRSKFPCTRWTGLMTMTRNCRCSACLASTAHCTSSTLATYMKCAVQRSASPSCCRMAPRQPWRRRRCDFPNIGQALKRISSGWRPCGARFNGRTAYG